MQVTKVFSPFAICVLYSIRFMGSPCAVSIKIGTYSEPSLPFWCSFTLLGRLSTLSLPPIQTIAMLKHWPNFISLLCLSTSVIKLSSFWTISCFFEVVYISTCSNFKTYSNKFFADSSYRKEYSVCAKITALDLKTI